MENDALARLESKLDEILRRLPDPRKSRKPKEKVTLPFTAADVIARLREQTNVILDPISGRLIKQLNKLILDTADLKPTDLDLLVCWIKSGGLASFPVDVRFDHVVKFFNQWIGLARHGFKPSDNNYDMWKDLK